MNEGGVLNYFSIFRQTVQMDPFRSPYVFSFAAGGGGGV